MKRHVDDEAGRHDQPAFPRFRIAVAFDVLAPEVGRRISQAAAVEPGAFWTVFHCEEEGLPAGALDAVAYGEIAEARRPRTLARLEAECARRGVELVRVPASCMEVADELPRRMRLARELELARPGTLRRVEVGGASSLQRSFAFEALSGTSSVRLPPAGPTVTLRRIERGIRIDVVGSTPRRGLVLWWDVSGLRFESVGLEEMPAGALPEGRLSVRGSSNDALSCFADRVAGERGLPRRLLEALIRRARVWLVRALPRRARRLAGLFHADIRGFVAANLADDETGRLEQLVSACPAVFALAGALPLPSKVNEFRRQVIAGEPLAAVCEPLFDSLRFMRTASDGRAGWSLRFLKRASPGVAPEWVSSGFPEGLALDDVPSTPAENIAWFHAAGLLASLTDGPGREGGARLAGFVSARGVELGRLSDDALESLYRRLLLRGRRLGRWPSRRTSVESACAMVGRWPESEHRAAAARFVLVPPSDPRLAVRPLETPADLACEGEEMHHCVASYLDEIERGETIAVSLRFGAERMTATLYPMDRGQLVIDQLAGFANNGPSVEAVRAVEAWLAEQRGRGRSPGTRI